MSWSLYIDLIRNALGFAIIYKKLKKHSRRLVRKAAVGLEQRLVNYVSWATQSASALGRARKEKQSRQG